MKRTLVILGIAALILGGSATAVLAQAGGPTGPAAPPAGPPHPGMGHPGMGPGMMMGALKALKLTAPQKQKMVELLAVMIRKSAPLRGEVMIKRAELFLLWSADQPEKGKILAKQAEMNGLRAKLYEARVDFRLGALKVLTPQQREHFKHLGMMRGMGGHRQFMGRGRGMGGMGPGMGGGGPGMGPMGMGGGEGEGEGQDHGPDIFAMDDFGGEDFDL